jgi:hypothetical protein
MGHIGVAAERKTRMHSDINVGWHRILPQANPGSEYSWGCPSYQYLIAAPKLNIGRHLAMKPKGALAITGTV